MKQEITSMINDAIKIEKTKHGKLFSVDDKAKLFLAPLDYILIADKTNGLTKINELINNAKTVTELIDEFSNLKKDDQGLSLYKNVIPSRFEELIQVINKLDNLETEKKLTQLLNKITIFVDENINKQLNEYFKKENINAPVNLYTLIKDYCNKRQSQVQIKKADHSNNETANNLESYLHPILSLKVKSKVSRYFIAPIDYLFDTCQGDEFIENTFMKRYYKFNNILEEGLENIRTLDSRYDDKVSQTFNGEKNLKRIKDYLNNLENENIYKLIIDIYQKIFEKAYHLEDKKNNIDKIVSNLTKACDEKSIYPEDLNIMNNDIIYKKAAILFIALIKDYFTDEANKKNQVIYPTLRNDVTYWHSLEVNNYLGVMEQYPYGSLQRFLALKQLANQGNLLAKLDVGSGYNYGTYLNDQDTTLLLESNDFISKQYLEFGSKIFIPGQELIKRINGNQSDLQQSRITITDLVALCEKYLDLVFTCENYDQFKEKIDLREFIELLIHLSYNSLADYHIKYCWYILTYHKYVNHQRVPIYIKQFFDDNINEIIELFQNEIIQISKFYFQKPITFDLIIENMNLEIDINIIKKLCGELKMIPNNILYYVGRLRDDRSFIEMGITKKDAKCIIYGLSFNTATLSNPNELLKNKIKLFIEADVDELRTKKIDILKTLIEIQEKINDYNEKISESYLKSRYELAKTYIIEQNEYKEMFNDLLAILNRLENN